MCGIAGCVGLAGDDLVAQAVRQVRTLDHRGPDSWGMFHGKGAAIGQTRLAVIDLVTGDPPISNEDGSVGAVLNGEIYNFQSLRGELRADGHKLSTEGDTEVLAHLAETHTPMSLARRLHGMFAFAVWDDRRRRLILGRDRFGKKPLYYWTGDGRLVFGSELKAVLAHPAVPRRLDPDAIPSYLTFGYVPTPKTFFEGIVSVPPGHILVKENDGLVLERYWEPAVAGRDGVQGTDLDPVAAAQEVRARLTAAVERRMVADVPLGAFLSGGVDSSAIVGIMAELTSRPVRTFTIGFEDNQGFDERPYAKVVASRFGTEHTEFVVNPEAVELVDKLVYHHDQPFGDSSAIPTYLLSELTRRHVTVALCGDGGDELFAGYERFTGALMLERFRRPLALVGDPLAKALESMVPGHSQARINSVARFLARTKLGLPDAFLAWNSFLGPELRRDFVGRAENWGTADYRRIWRGTEGCDTLDRLLDLNLRTYLLDDLLPKVDRMAMANALEVRSPFLDHELAEFALRLPRSARVRGFRRKRVLKAAVRDLLPPDILNRRKRGFGIPLDRWFRTDLQSYVESMLGTEHARVRAHIDPRPLDGLLLEHRKGTANRGASLWALLTLEVFLRREDW